MVVVVEMMMMAERMVVVVEIMMMALRMVVVVADNYPPLQHPYVPNDPYHQRRIHTYPTIRSINVATIRTANKTNHTYPTIRSTNVATIRTAIATNHPYRQRYNRIIEKSHGDLKNFIPGNSVFYFRNASHPCAISLTTFSDLSIRFVPDAASVMCPMMEISKCIRSFS
jgi:hypothetical protein